MKQAQKSLVLGVACFCVRVYGSRAEEVSALRLQYQSVQRGGEAHPTCSAALAVATTVC